MDPAKIRNFAIIAHIDHGKTTLTDRLLELVGQAGKNQNRQLDSHPIEQERGITIKLAPVTLNYKDHQLNLIDTPGHIDFNYEVERSLAACEGAILLVDATKGVQAQTVANLRLAQKQGLKIIPVINKVDLPAAEPEATATAILELLPDTTDILEVSAKTGQNADKVLDAVIAQVPSPKQEKEDSLKALVFNSVFHPHLGVIAFVRLFAGSVKKDSRLRLLQNKQIFSPVELGVFAPAMKPLSELTSGQVGYIATGLKDIHSVQVGDTLTLEGTVIDPLPGYRHIQPNVYLEVYPSDNSEYKTLLDAVEKIKLHDSALETEPVSSPALGNGLRVGFLGLLHADIFAERLSLDFDLAVTLTSPSVAYQLTLRSGQELVITRPSDYPDPSVIKESREPISNVTIITPAQYFGPVATLLEESRGIVKNTTYLNENTLELTYSVPLIEVITHLHDKLKSVSSGYASMDYSPEGYNAVELTKLEVVLNEEPIEPLARLEIKQKAQSTARELASKLKELIPQHQFKIPIQIKSGGEILAREDVKAFRKDVTAKLYGGDRTRRMKLLEKQKKGKKKMRSFGTVSLPPEVFKSTI